MSVDRDRLYTEVLARVEAAFDEAVDELIVGLRAMREPFCQTQAQLAVSDAYEEVTRRYNDMRRSFAGGAPSKTRTPPAPPKRRGRPPGRGRLAAALAAAQKPGGKRAKPRRAKAKAPVRPMNGHEKKIQKRPPGELQELGQKIRDFVAKKPGAFMEEISAGTGFPSLVLKLPMAKLNREGTIEADGKKRGKYYWLAGTPRPPRRPPPMPPTRSSTRAQA